MEELFKEIAAHIAPGVGGTAALDWLAAFTDKADFAEDLQGVRYSLEL